MNNKPEQPVKQERSLRQQLLRGGIAGVLVRVGSIVAALVASITLARILGPETYGIYAFVFSVIGLLGLPVQMGLPTLILRETARADQAKDGALMNGIRRWSDLAMILMSCVVFVAAGVYFWLTSGIDSARQDALFWALPLVLLIGLVEARGAVLRGLRHVALGVGPNKVMRPLLLAGSVIVATRVFNEPLSAGAILTLQSGVALVVLAFLGIVIWKVDPKHAGFAAPRYRSKQWTLAILPLSAISGLQIVSQNTDILMLGALATDTEVGLYRVALSSANFVAFGLTAAAMVLAPHFARATKAENLTQLQKLASLSARAAFLSTVPICAAFWVYGDAILSVLYGNDYNRAYAALVLLSIGQAINAFFGSVIPLLTMSGREWIAVSGMLISTIVNVALNWLLIPMYGIEGAAIATGVSVVVWNVCLWAACWKLLGIDSSPFGFRPAPPPAKGKD